MKYHNDHRLTDPVLAARVRLALNYANRGNPNASGFMLYVNAIIARRIDQDLAQADHMSGISAAKVAQYNRPRATLQGMSAVTVERAIKDWRRTWGVDK